MRHLDTPAHAKSCRIFSDVLTKVAEDRYYYPDVVVTCGPLSPRGVILSPCFVVLRALDFPKRIKEGDEFTTEEYGREWVLVPADTVS